MNIQTVSTNTIARPTLRKNEQVTIPQTGLKNDVFQASAFSLENAVKELKEMKGLRNAPKFDDAKLEILTDELKKSPEKWTAIKSMSAKPQMIGSIICDIAKKDTEDVNAINKLVQMKTPEGEDRFRPLEIRSLAKSLSGKALNNAQILAESNLGLDNIIDLAQNENVKDPKKMADKANEMSKLCGENLLTCMLTPDPCDKNGFLLTGLLKNGDKKLQLFDDKMNTLSVEENKNYSKGSKQYTEKKVKDFRNNTTSKVVLETKPKCQQQMVALDIRVVRDKDGKLIRREYAEQSDIDGTMNIKHVYPDGSTKEISSAKKDEKTGITTIKKNMESLDGTKTEYLYEDDPQGNRLSDYKITDKNGKVLLNNSQTFEVVNDKKFISSKNGNSYEITVGDKELNIKDVKSGETSKIEFENYITGNTENLLKSLKQMPGEELIALSKVAKKLNGVDDMTQSTFACKSKTIKSADNLYVILHELGHAKDYDKVDIDNQETFKDSIFSDKKFNEIFTKEKELFNKEFPTAQRGHISYFIENTENSDGREEAIAETNALLNSRNTENLFSMRSQYLQQYFPKTIAYLSDVLAKQ